MSPVQIHPDQLIHYIKEQAAEQAAQAARERLNFFFTMIGVLLAVVGAIGATTLVGMESRIKADVDARIADGIATSMAGVESQAALVADQLKALVTTELSETKADLAKELEGLLALSDDRVRTRAEDAMRLPLLVSEANSLRTLEGSYDLDQILDSLEIVRSRLDELPQDIRTLVLSRVGDIIEAMIRAGDDYGVLAVRGMFGDALPLRRSVYYNVARAQANLLIYDRASTREEDVDAFLGEPIDLLDRRLVWAKGYLTVTHAAIVDAASVETLAAMLSEMEARDPGATSGVLAEVCNIYGAAMDGRFSPNNAAAGQNASRLIDAAAPVMARYGMTGPDPDSLCWQNGDARESRYPPWAKDPSAVPADLRAPVPPAGPEGGPATTP